MSKMDDLRAMREARYAQTAARSAKPDARPVKPAAPARKAAAAAPPAPETAAEQLCGHRNMGGRTCTREHGHAAKSHRYS